MPVHVALIGDYNAAVAAHRAIPEALRLAARETGCEVSPAWIPTPMLEPGAAGPLMAFDGVWCVPASPYASMAGALGGIRFARETGRPFLGTCGGFQHAVIEYARNVLGLAEADHAETNPQASLPLIAPLACSLVEQNGEILFEPHSRVRTIYDADRATETYHCNYGLHPAHRQRLEETGALRVTGQDAEGSARVIELGGHPFFLATLFQPERAALAGKAHPLVNAFVAAAAARARQTL